MTVWPGVRLPFPPLFARRVRYRLHESGLALIGSDGYHEIADAPRREIYLKLQAVDLDDPEAIVRFANRFGTPTTGYRAGFEQNSWLSGLFSWEQEQATLARVHDADPSLREQLAVIVPTQAQIEVVSLSSLRFSAGLLQDLTNAWRVVSNDRRLDLPSHSWRLPYGADPQTQRTRWFAFQLLCSALPPLLSGFAPSLRGVREDAPEGRRRQGTLPTTPGIDVDARPGLEFVPLTEFCALELFNHIVDGEIYRECQNEHCDNLFVCQYGRAEHGQSKREGVLYCSTECAQAQAARAYRRRQRAKLQQPPRSQGAKTKQARRARTPRATP